MSSGGNALRGLSAVIAVLSGAGILVMWGLYASIWSLVGVMLFFLGVGGGMLVWREQECDGAVPFVAAAIIGYYLFPIDYMPGVFRLAVIGFIVAAIMAIAAFEIDRE